MSTLYVTTLCDHPNSDEFRPAPVRHLDLDTPAFYYYRKNPKCYHTVWGILQNTEKYAFSGRMLTPQKHHLTTKSDFSSWAGCCGQPKSTRIIMRTRLQFLGRMLRNTEKYENYRENSTSVLGPDVAAPKRSKKHEFIVKTPFKSIAEHRKVRELPLKMNTEEVEEPKKYENLQTKPVLDPFKSAAEHRKVRELPRKMNIEEVEEPETTKIYRQNPRASARPPRKLRKFTDETNMKARKHENSDEFRAPAVRHLDLATPAFYHCRKNPKCYHTVWGTNSSPLKIGLLPQKERIVSQASIFQG